MKKSGRLGQGGIIREDHMICSLRTSSLTFLKNTIHQDNSFPKSLYDTKETYMPFVVFFIRNI